MPGTARLASSTTIPSITQATVRDRSWRRCRIGRGLPQGRRLPPFPRLPCRHPTLSQTEHHAARYPLAVSAGMS
jgi:hypothetical protein